MIKILYRYSSFLLALILIAACSELNTDIPPAPKVNTHGDSDSLYSPTSPNYHVKTIADSPNGWDDCKECHAADFSGGPSGAACNGCHPGIGAHQTGYLDPSSKGFHGNFIRNNGWDMISCHSCHGPKYAGKVAVPDYTIPGCIDCHTYYGGPENCTTCHGSSTSNAPPRDLDGNTSNTSRGVGAHQAHLGANVNGKSLTCNDCHVVPGGVYSHGHIDSDNRAEIIFYSTIANIITNDESSPSVPIDPNQPTYIPAPVYNPADLTCANTYCHGYFKNGNVDNKPIWNDPSTSQCGSCHGDGSNPLPKTQSQGGNHPGSNNCSVCHGGVVDATQKIINPSKHIDGLLNLFGNDIKY
jgi:predicted CxxxxCH...CXXCH cytochrome family protein